MITRIALIITVTFSCVASSVCSGDSWGPITKFEFHSANRQHVLKIAPHEDWPDKPGHCRATLYRIDDVKRTEIWSRFLINNHAPVSAFVSNSGNFVLTMDEWHSVGELPVVIYGGRGELIRVHSTDSLGLRDDISHIKMTVSSYWWNEDSVSFFGPKEELLFIRLHWGKFIVLQLRDGEIFLKDQIFFRDDLRKQHERKWNTLEEFRRKTLARHAIKMLSSTDANDRKTGAMICGQEGLSSAIPKLKNLLTDAEYYTTNDPRAWTRVYYVRQAAKAALEELGENADTVVVTAPE
tara:strand:- start:2310 stop:3194 length:885 start_codon:yes stop_codon:yes gene_type:complete